MEEVKEHRRNLAVSYYDYKKAYDRVYHDWMLMVFEWMGVDEKVCKVIRKLTESWKLYIKDEKGNMIKTRSICIRRGFFQGDSFSAVGFCLTEVPIGMLLEDTPGYIMGDPGNRTCKRTHGLFIDDLKVYSSDHEKLSVINETITKASLDLGAAYGVKKCAEIVIEKGIMVKGEGLEVLEERMKCLDPIKYENYKFLGYEQSDSIKKDAILNRIKAEMMNRLNRVLDSKLCDKFMIRAINTHVIPVAAYAMNLCTLSKAEIYELDMLIKKQLRKRGMHGFQCSNERLYLPRSEGGRGLKSLVDVYAETKIRIACYLSQSTDPWLKIVWNRDLMKEYTSIHRFVESEFAEIEQIIKFGVDEVILNGEKIGGNWKSIKEILNKIWKKGKSKLRGNSLKEKNQQGQVWRNLGVEDHAWLISNIDPRKAGSIIRMQEQMVETRGWKYARNLVENKNCRVCGRFDETVEHL